MKRKISIVIPVYNEKNTITEIVERVKKVNLPLEKEIIIVDDGSKDGSYDIAKTITGIKVLRHDKNKGKGAAIKTGLNNCTGEIFLVQDADLELDPKEIPKVAMPLIEGNSRVVYGSRNPKILNINSHPFFYLGGIVITKITNLLYHTKLTDEPCGYKAFRTEILKKINFFEQGFGWEPEITARISKRKIKIDEVIVEFNAKKSRSAKEGKKLRVRDGLDAAWILIKNKFR